MMVTAAAHLAQISKNFDVFPKSCFLILLYCTVSLCAAIRPTHSSDRHGGTIEVNRRVKLMQPKLSITILQ